MTPKEKAQEIIEEFNDFPLTPLGKKIFALKLVNKIIKEFEEMSDLKSIIVVGENVYSVVNYIKWWQEIRNEIENYKA